MDLEEGKRDMLKHFFVHLKIFERNGLGWRCETFIWVIKLVNSVNSVKTVKSMQSMRLVELGKVVKLVKSMKLV